MQFLVRRASGEDAPAITDLYLATRRTFLPYAPIPHTDDLVAHWMEHHLIPNHEVWVMERTPDLLLLGFLALKRTTECGWIDQLYLRPEFTGQGLGTGLLEFAKHQLGTPIRLYTFQQNAGARQFYERHGFKPIAFGDGTGNEEGCPDVLYEWTGE